MKAHDLEIIGGQSTAEALEIASLQLGAGATINLFDDDTTLSANSHTRVATQAAVRSYVDAAVPGTGNLIFQLNSKVEVTDTGANGQVVMDADGTEVFSVTSNAQRLGVSGDTNVFVNQSADTVTVAANNTTTLTVSDGQVTIHGDLAVDGTTFVVNNQEVTTSDNIILVNAGEAGAGVTAGEAGIQVDRGSLTDYQFLFDESVDLFRIGEIGSLQAVATRQDSPTDAGMAFWNDAQKRYDNSGNATLTAAGAMEAASLNLTAADAFSWEDGVNWITNNDGGGNVQIRFGHKHDVTEVFTHDAGTAFYIGGALDSSTGALVLKVASNGAASGIEGTTVTWGDTLTLGATTLVFTGDITGDKVYGAVWG